MNYIICRYIIFFILIIVAILYIMIKILLLNKKCADANVRKRNVTINI